MLSFLFLTYIIVRFKITPEGIITKYRANKKNRPEKEAIDTPLQTPVIEDEFELKEKT